MNSVPVAVDTALRHLRVFLTSESWLFISLSAPQKKTKPQQGHEYFSMVRPKSFGYLEPSVPLWVPVIFHAALPTPTSREKSSGEADRHRVYLIYYNFFCWPESLCVVSYFHVPVRNKKGIRNSGRASLPECVMKTQTRGEDWQTSATTQIFHLRSKMDKQQHGSQSPSVCDQPCLVFGGGGGGDCLFTADS